MKAPWSIPCSPASPKFSCKTDLSASISISPRGLCSWSSSSSSDSCSSFSVLSTSPTFVFVFDGDCRSLPSAASFMAGGIPFLAMKRGSFDAWLLQFGSNANDGRDLVSGGRRSNSSLLASALLKRTLSPPVASRAIFGYLLATWYGYSSSVIVSVVSLPLGICLRNPNTHPHYIRGHRRIRTCRRRSGPLPALSWFRHIQGQGWMSRRVHPVKSVSESVSWTAVYQVVDDYPSLSVGVERRSRGFMGDRDDPGPGVTRGGCHALHIFPGPPVLFDHHHISTFNNNQ